MTEQERERERQKAGQRNAPQAAAPGAPDADGGWITREYTDAPASPGLPPATPPTAREWRAEGEEQRPGILDAMPPVGLPVISVSKPGAEPIVEAKYMRRVNAGSGAYGPRQDLDLTNYARSRPMSMREAADAGLFADSTPRGVEMDPSDKARAGFMRPFAERGQEARPGATTGRQVDDILKRLERAREMDSRQTDVTARNEQGVGAGEAFRQGLNETRDLRWGASGPTSAVNRAIAERRGRGEQTDEAIRLAKEAPPPQAGALKPLTPKDAGNIIAKRFNLLQGDGVTKVRQEAVTEAKRLETLLRENGYGSLLGDEPEAGPTVRGAAGKEKPGERVWNAKYKAYYIRQPDGTLKREQR